jgi:hypothetical protein
MAETRGKAYWKIFNTLGKIVGIGFLLVGLVILVFGIARWDWLIVIPGFVVSSLGVLLVIARPYSPDGRNHD